MVHDLDLHGNVWGISEDVMCKDGYTFPPCNEERNKPGLHLSILSFRSGP